VSEAPRNTALVVGAGGLGAAAALALAAGGISRIVLADGRPVAASDLAAQPLLTEHDLGRSRAEASAAALSRRFPALAFEAAGQLDTASAPGLVAAADVVVDASNRFQIMFAANDAAAAARRPLVHGAVLRWTAQLLTVLPGETGCLRCLFEGPPPGPGGEVEPPGPLAALAGALLGSEALRLLAGEPAAYAGNLLEYEARAARPRRVPLPRRAACPACCAGIANGPGGGVS
jgi:adenylyltransferase/sulfurtransferase